MTTTATRYLVRNYTIEADGAKINNGEWIYVTLTTAMFVFCKQDPRGDWIREYADEWRLFGKTSRRALTTCSCELAKVSYDYETDEIKDYIEFLEYKSYSHIDYERELTKVANR